MEDLFEEFKKKLVTGNKQVDSKNFKIFEIYLNYYCNINKLALELKNDPDTPYDKVDEEVESSLIENCEKYVNSIKILKNIFTDKVEQTYISRIDLLYNITYLAFAKAGFSKGFSHYYALINSFESLKEESLELTLQLTIDHLSSISNQELESIKLKNKLFQTLTELSTNISFSSTRMDKYINSIELAKQIKFSNENPIPLNSPKASIQIDNSQSGKLVEFKRKLNDFGFFELTKVKSLTHDGQLKLIDLLLLNDTPYIIAMFDFLGYFKYLTNEYGLTNSKIHSKVGSWLNTNTQTIKCNMLVLNEKSALRENNRYTAHLHKEKVKTDYYSLK